MQETAFNQVGLNLCFTQVRKGKSEKVRTGDTLWRNFIDSLDERFAFQWVGNRKLWKVLKQEIYVV